MKYSQYSKWTLNRFGKHSRLALVALPLSAIALLCTISCGGSGNSDNKSNTVHNESGQQIEASLDPEFPNLNHLSLNHNLSVHTNSPALTQWQPEGLRLASNNELNSSILPKGDHFYTIHGGVRSADEVNVVFAPVFEQTWNTESTALVTESPVFGDDGSAYFIPASPTDDGQNMLIKVNKSGERVFAVTRDMIGDEAITLTDGTVISEPATYGQGASPIVLNDPLSGNDIVYAATYLKAYAVDADGNVLWNVSIEPESFKNAVLEGSQAAVDAVLEKPHRIFGINYQPSIDAIIVADISGDITALDRATGTRLGGITMPGAPARGGDNTFEESDNFLVQAKIEQITSRLQELLVSTFEADNIEVNISEDQQSALTAVLGEGAVIGNQVSVDPNTNSLWVASTDFDEADGNEDGFSELGALFRLDLTRVASESGDTINFEFVCHASFDGGTTSTPAVSADGLRIYTTDNFGSAIAIDRDCERAWSLDVGEAAVASLAVSSEVGAEIYYPTLNNIYKIQENETRDGASLVWAADLRASFTNENILEVAHDTLYALKAALEDIIDWPISNSDTSFGAKNMDLATIGQNGIMVHSGYGMAIKLNNRELFLPIALNNAIYDRETGEFINGNTVIEENIGAMYTSRDGTITMGSSPIRRALIRAIARSPEFEPPELSAEITGSVANLVDFLVPPLNGGITQYGVTERFDLIVRDSVCQGEKVLRNLLEASDGEAGSSEGEKLNIVSLLDQAISAVGSAQGLGELVSDNLNDDLMSIKMSVQNNDFGTALSALTQTCIEYNR